MKQPGQIDFLDEMIVDNFAGGGGASTGIELATGRIVDIAINHDPDAILMHKTNHPYTDHLQASVWDVDPVEVCKGRKVGLAWFSPDCKHFSKAKGSTPVEKSIRGLAWIVLRWAGKVRPRVIILENVEEFKTWGPVRKGRPVKSKSGQTFEKWKSQLEALGYVVEHRELIAAEYGAPTTRKRLFVIARCDGKPIVWPERTHGPGKLPYRSAAEIIDFSLPVQSIFGRKKPLAENTMKRIAKGLKKFVIDNPEPFIVQVNHSGESFRGQSMDEPLSTVTAKHGYGLVTPLLSQLGQTGGGDRLHDIQKPLSTIVSKAEHMLVTPFITQYHGFKAAEARGQEVDTPLTTVDASNRYALVSAFISKYYAGYSRSTESDVSKPLHTVTSVDHNRLMAVFLSKFYKTGVGQAMAEPLHTITTSIGHFAEVRAFLIKYYGQGIGQSIADPLDTVVSKDRFGLVMVAGEQYQIVDIGMRMLTPRELYNAQGFPVDYVINHDYTGKAYPKSKQVARCGNAVPPPFAEALVRANLPEWCAGKIDTMEQLRSKIAANS